MSVTLPIPGVQSVTVPSGSVCGIVEAQPATGIGTLRIVGVREKLSTAVVESGETPVRGNLLKLE